MKIYTKTGDSGNTSLFGGERRSKNDARISAYGTIDELNSVLGCARSATSELVFQEQLLALQKQLFVLGSELANPKPSGKVQAGFIDQTHIDQLENIIDQWEGKLPPLRQFILPGGSAFSSWIHLARTVSRRVEREMVALNQIEPFRPLLLAYINRLSDYFFVMARFANHQAGVNDILWEGIL